MTTFTITINDKSAQDALTALGRKVSDLRPALRDIGRDMVQRAKLRFNTSTGPDGQVWRPKKLADGRKTLVGGTGTLRRLIRYSLVGGTAVVVRASAPYAAIHQFGGTIKRKGGVQTIRHRTNAKGELLRRTDLEAFGGKGLIFAKASHERQLARQVQVGPYSIRMPARPFMAVAPGGALYAAERQAAEATLAQHFATASTASTGGPAGA